LVNFYYHLGMVALNGDGFCYLCKKKHKDRAQKTESPKRTIEEMVRIGMQLESQHGLLSELERLQHFIALRKQLQIERRSSSANATANADTDADVDTDATIDDTADATVDVTPDVTVTPAATVDDTPDVTATPAATVDATATVDLTATADASANTATDTDPTADADANATADDNLSEMESLPQEQVRNARQRLIDSYLDEVAGFIERKYKFEEPSKNHRKKKKERKNQTCTQ
jgi:hypothetical protein